MQVGLTAVRNCLLRREIWQKKKGDLLDGIPVAWNGMGEGQDPPPFPYDVEQWGGGPNIQPESRF